MFVSIFKGYTDVLLLTDLSYKSFVKTLIKKHVYYPVIVSCDFIYIEFDFFDNSKV